MNRFLSLRWFIMAPLMLVLMLTGFGCKGGSKKVKESVQPVTINWWRIGGSPQEVANLVAEYKQIRPNVTINVIPVREEELEQSLVQALADGQAPDIVTFPNTWLRGWQHRLAPLPPTLNLPYLEITGTIKKEPRWVLKNIPSLDIKTIRSRYVDVVVNDIYLNGQIYGLPQSLDTLMVFYNIDLLNAAQFPEAPATWNDFKEASQRITKLDRQGRLLQNGAALGTADNIPYVFDILSALMMQNGTPMTKANGTASFNEALTVEGETYFPGADALRFYTDFANPTKETYCWSAEQQNAREAFAAGKLGFIFGYWRDLPTLKAMAPRIRIGIAKFPQIEGSFQTSYYANYFIEAVMKQSQNQEEAWDFIQFINAPKQNKKYLDANKKPTAQREFVTEQLADENLSVPAAQVLTAKNWYRGYNYKAAENAFMTMVRQTLTGTTYQEALNTAAKQINQTMKKP